MSPLSLHVTRCVRHGTVGQSLHLSLTRDVTMGDLRRVVANLKAEGNEVEVTKRLENGVAFLKEGEDDR